MNAEFQSTYPHLAQLWSASDTASPDNYFCGVSAPVHSRHARDQYEEWNRLIGALDHESLPIFIRKAAGRVSTKDPTRAWAQLVDSMNELRAYSYAKSLGYSTVNLLNEGTNDLPDIYAYGDNGACLLEVKTIHRSDVDLELFGDVQKGEAELPLRLKRAIRKAYKKAEKQIFGHPNAHASRRILYLRIDLDLRTVLHAGNSNHLREYVEELDDSVEIHATSMHW